MKCELENNTVVVSGTEYIELFLPECIRQKETEYYMSLLFNFNPTYKAQNTGKSDDV